MNPRIVLGYIAVGLTALCLGVYVGSIGDQSVSKTAYSKPAPPAPVVHKEGDPELLLSGYIRSINWEDRAFVYETDWGFIKAIGPICGNDPLPLWVGMRLYEVNFHWKVYDQVNDTRGCFTLDYIGHAPTGDLK